jgi:predicted nucleotidyltransferase
MKEIERYRAEILRIAAEYGASNLRISGADAGPGADIDVLVDVAPDRSLFDLVDMARELGALLDRKVDVYAASSLNPRLLEGLLADARPLQ